MELQMQTNYQRYLLPTDEENVGKERQRVTGVSSLNDWVNNEGVMHTRYTGEATESGRKY